MKNFFKKNFKLMIGFVIGGIIFSEIGYVVAENIAASNITYTNNNQSTVDGALNDLYDKANAVPVECYNGVCGKLSYKYWNDGRSGTKYNKTSIPNDETKTAPGGRTYTSRIAFANAVDAAYTGSGKTNKYFSEDPRYIRSVLIDGNVVGHEACLYYNNREFCIAPKYWAGTIGTEDETVGTNTKIKLQRDMEAALGTTASSCPSGASSAYCYFGSFGCYANLNGIVGCFGVNYCYVNSDGSALCS